MTKREVFDKVKKHLLEQGVKSKEGASCLYRGPGGTKCAIGCLISDELYEAKMEGMISDSPLIKEAIAASIGISVEELHSGYAFMLVSLQTIHDGWPVWDWKKEIDTLEQQTFGESNEA